MCDIQMYLPPPVSTVVMVKVHMTFVQVNYKAMTSKYCNLPNIFDNLIYICFHILVKFLIW